MKKNMRKEENLGITLIALVITIIVLLILATISIAMLTGENGLLTKATKAKEETEINHYKEQIELTREELKLQNEDKDYDQPTIYQMEEALKQKEWVKTTEIINDEEDGNIEKLKLTTKEEYIFYITETEADEIKVDSNLKQIEELKSQIENLTKENTEQKSQIESLITENNQLKSQIEALGSIKISIYDKKTDSYKAWSAAGHTLTLSSEIEKGKYIIVLNGSRSNQSNSGVTNGNITFNHQNATQLYSNQYNDSIVQNDGAQLLTISNAYLLEINEKQTINSSFTAEYAMNMNYTMTILKIEQ